MEVIVQIAWLVALMFWQYKAGVFFFFSLLKDTPSRTLEHEACVNWSVITPGLCGTGALQGVTLFILNIIVFDLIPFERANQTGLLYLKVNK